MIEIKDGDLLEATEDIIGHQVNCLGRMGSGVAKQIRDRFRYAYNEYRWLTAKTKPEELLGHCQIVERENQKTIANLFGQLNYGYDGAQYTSYYALKSALTALKEFAQSNNYTVALPYKIGSDRGGAEWHLVYGIIDEVFDDYKVALYKIRK